MVRRSNRGNGAGRAMSLPGSSRVSGRSQNSCLHISVGQLPELPGSDFRDGPRNSEPTPTGYGRREIRPSRASQSLFAPGFSMMIDILETKPERIKDPSDAIDPCNE